MKIPRWIAIVLDATVVLLVSGFMWALFVALIPAPFWIQAVYFLANVLIISGAVRQANKRRYPPDV